MWTPRVPRPLRLEFAGALYHLTSRGERREDIFLNDEDRGEWLYLLGTTRQRFNWVVHAHCKIRKHSRLMVESVDGSMARGMRRMDGQYTQRFDWRHALVGHRTNGTGKEFFYTEDHYASFRKVIRIPTADCEKYGPGF